MWVGQFLEVVDQLGHVEFPKLVSADHFVELAELLIIEGPEPIGAFLGMLDRDEVHRPDDSIRAHRVDDVLRIGTRAGIVIHFGTDRKAHTAAQPLGHDGRVGQVDARRLGGAEQVAGLSQFQGAANGIDRARVLERQIVCVVGDHQEAR